MKRIVSVALAVMLLFSLAVCVQAQQRNYIIDEFGNVAADDMSRLDQQAQTLYESSGVAAFFVYADIEDILSYDTQQLTDGLEDYVIMAENRDSWCMFTGGKGNVIDDQAQRYLRSVYDNEDTYRAGLEAYLVAVSAYFLDQPGVVSAAGSWFVLDEAGLLSDDETAALTQNLQSLSGTYQCQIVLVTVPAVAQSDISAYASNMYDQYDIGYGQDKTGILLMVCMNPREFRIVSNGSAANVLTDGRISSITERITPYLSDGDYAAAFNVFAQRCDYYYDGEINGFPFKTGQNIIISLVIGLIAGLIVAFVLKGQLKSVKKQDQANAYVRQGSMELTQSKDIYLYSNITRTAKQQSSSSSGSGSSRNIGGGSF